MAINYQNQTSELVEVVFQLLDEQFGELNQIQIQDLAFVLDSAKDLHHIWDRFMNNDVVVGQTSPKMAHGLRNALNAIIGYTTLLLDGIEGELNDQQYDAIVEVNRTGCEMLDVVNNLFVIGAIS